MVYGLDIFVKNGEFIYRGNNLRQQIRELQENARENSHGLFLTLREEKSPEWNYFKIYSVDGEGFDKTDRLDHVAGGVWPKPVMVTVTYNKNSIFGYDLTDTIDRWGVPKKFGWVFTKNCARAKSHARARRIAEIIAKKTNLALIERSDIRN
jgi:hypothetical protein